MRTDYNKEHEYQRKRHIVWHAFASFCITPKMQEAVLTYFESPENALAAGAADWNTFFRMAEQFGFKASEKEKIFEVLKRDHEKEYDSLAEKEIRFVIKEDAVYPEKLKTLYGAPLYFYYKGTVPGNEPLIAIIGARNCSPYGSETARRLARELAERRIGVISGLAYGVDKAAHDGALDGGGPTFAVLGCGVDICYPKSNRVTYDKIISKGGGILSEYPPGTQPLSCFFPQRNRIIAGLSDGILVTEARKKSGTLITVSFGLEYGKNIYAVPGRIEDVLSEGCNFLIKEGAKLTNSVSDILEDMDFYEKKQKNSVQKYRNYENFKNILATNEKIVYASLRLRPKHIDEIQEATKLSPEDLSKALHSLCSYGCIKRCGQAYYALSEEANRFLMER
ncbi:MAG: DNA-processing protein DprA [Lachnospiraceae bacterium]|nr:DNA-processing protein DprA [Lachnospiraceae bacterium]